MDWSVERHVNASRSTGSIHGSVPTSYERSVDNRPPSSGSSVTILRKKLCSGLIAAYSLGLRSAIPFRRAGPVKVVAVPRPVASSWHTSPRAAASPVGSCVRITRWRRPTLASPSPRPAVGDPVGDPLDRAPRAPQVVPGVIRDQCGAGMLVTRVPQGTVPPPVATPPRGGHDPLGSERIERTSGRRIREFLPRPPPAAPPMPPP